MTDEEKVSNVISMRSRKKYDPKVDVAGFEPGPHEAHVDDASVKALEDALARAKVGRMASVVITGIDPTYMRHIAWLPVMTDVYSNFAYAGYVQSINQYFLDCAYDANTLVESEEKE